MQDAESRLHVSFLVNRSLFERLRSPLATGYSVENYAPGFTLIAQGSIDCPNGDCAGSVPFKKVLVSRTVQNRTLAKTGMYQPLPQAVIDHLVTNISAMLEKGERINPFFGNRDVGYAGHHHFVPENRVDCPACGMTYTATPEQQLRIPMLAADWVAKLGPADVPLWDENEDGLLTPEGKRLKPGIVTYNRFPGLGKSKPQATEK